MASANDMFILAKAVRCVFQLVRNFLTVHSLLYVCVGIVIVLCVCSVICCLSCVVTVIVLLLFRLCLRCMM